MSNKTNIVLSTRWAAEILQHRTEVLTGVIGGEPLSDKVAVDVVFMVVEELIAMRQLWLRPRAFNYHAITDYCNKNWIIDNREVVLPQLTGDAEPVTVRDVFLCNILGPLVNEVEKHLLNPYFPDRSFDYLDLARMETGDILVTNIGDYRVWRFEQLVREGKVKY